MGLGYEAYVPELNKLNKNSNKTAVQIVHARKTAAGGLCHRRMKEKLQSGRGLWVACPVSRTAGQSSGGYPVISGDAQRLNGTGPGPDGLGRRSGGDDNRDFIK